jgi:hypothetical protein
MQNSPNQGAWLGGNAQQPPIVSQDLKKLYAMYQMSNDPKSFMQQVMSANPTLEAMSHGNGKEMSETSKMSEETAREWVSKMENTDGTTGAHWTIDATTAVRDKLGLKHICKYEFWAIMNSLYSDYGKTLAKTNATPEIYGELARDWIEDDDAVKAKASAYYRYVVAHD